MVQIAGKYQFVSAENMPQPQGDRPAGPGGPPKDFIMEISVDGSKYTFTSNTPKGPRVVVYEDGKETEHTGFRGETLKANTKVSVDAIEVNESGPNGKDRKKTYKFSSDGYVESWTGPDGKEAKIVFKRL